MAERPLSLTAEMARATLDGRKTQTRRPVTIEWSRCLDLDSAVDRMAAIDRCPYGRPGDRLWIREPARIVEQLAADRVLVEYLADGHQREVQYPERLARPIRVGHGLANGCHREASRALVEVTTVRVERVQATSEADAMAEGARSQDAYLSGTHRGAFCGLWDSIYAARGLGWSADPWVWVVGYRVVEVRHV